MAALALGLMAVFGLVAVVGSIMVLVSAFRESAGWGLACLFLPGASLLFVFTHWEEAKRGFLLNIGGVLGLFVAILLMPKPAPVDDDDPSSPTAKAAKAKKAAPGPACPGVEAATNGFVKWCCTGEGWSQLSKGSDCGTIFYRPTETCSAATVGQSSTTACATAPKRDNRRF